MPNVFPYCAQSVHKVSPPPKKRNPKELTINNSDTKELSVFYSLDAQEKQGTSRNKQADGELKKHLKLSTCGLVSKGL